MAIRISRSQALALLGATPAVLRAVPAAAQGAPLRMAAEPAEIFAEPVFVVGGGYLAKAGLSGGITRFTTSGQVVQAVIGGSLDLGLSDMTQIANAHNRDIPLAFIAGSGMYRSESPSTILCVAKDSSVHSARDLEGQVVGVNGLRTMAEISTREWLRRNGADLSKIRFTEIPASLAVPSLQRGTVPAAIVGEPFYSEAGDAIRLLAKPYDMIARNFYVSAWFAKRDWIAQNAATVRKLVGAIYDTARWANTHPDETAPLLAKWLSVDVEKIKAAPRAAFATSLDPKMMQPVLDLAVRYNLVEKPVEASALIARID